jgi:hypothetical protein
VVYFLNLLLLLMHLLHPILHLLPLVLGLHYFLLLHLLLM